MSHMFERMLRSEYIANHLMQLISSHTIKDGEKLPTEEVMCGYYKV